LGAGVVVGIAAGIVRLRRVRADAIRGIAGACAVTLIGRRTDDGWARGTDAGLTAVVLGAGVVVGIPAGIVRLRRVRADASRGVARADVVTLIGRRTDAGWARVSLPDALPIFLGAGVVVGIAAGIVRLRRVRADA